MKKEKIFNDKTYKRIIKAFDKIRNTDIGNIDIKGILDDNTSMCIPISDSNLFIYVMSDVSIKRLKRQEIIKTLMQINYQRKDKKWTPCTIIGFIEEVFTLYYNNAYYEINDNFKEDKNLIIAKYCKDEESYNKAIQNISKRYNVTKSRFNPQIALFLLNLKNNKDNSNMLKYFNYYEIVLWKYKDIEKLQKLIEEEKVPAIDLLYLQNLGIIE